MFLLKDLREGLSFSQIITVTEEAVKAFAEATGDHNPIHFSDDVAQKAGFPKRVAHGQLVVAMANPLLTERVDGIILREQKIIARRPVPVGEKVLVTANISSPPTPFFDTHTMIEWKVTFTCNGKICFIMEAKTLIPNS